MLRHFVLVTAAILLVMAAACSGGDDGPTATSGASPTATGGPTPMPLPPHATFYGADPGDQAGAIVSGDFNGDGTPDVALGAMAGDGPDQARPDTGEVHIFLGPFAADDVRDARTDANATFFGAAPGDQLGRTLAVADFNGDRTDDLAMAAPAAGGEAGAVYVYMGTKQPERITFDLATPGQVSIYRGIDAQDFAGLSLATGELDGDGRPDLLIGALLGDGPANDRPDAGEVYFVSGATIGTQPDSSLSTAGAIYGDDAGDRLGEALTTGDVDGDGRTDAVLVAPFADRPENDRDAAGETYVFTSLPAFPADVTSAQPFATVLGTDAGDQLGHSVAVCEGGGLWLGAVSADGPGNAVDLAGEGVLVAGHHAHGVVDTAAGGVPVVFGPAQEARLGRSAACGDLDGDGVPEMLMSAPNMDERAGRLFIFNGAADLPEDAGAAALSIVGEDAEDTLGHESNGMPSLSVANVIEGVPPEILVSAPQGDGPDGRRKDAGEAYALFGVR